MLISYVNLKSELTAQIECARDKANTEAYRTSLRCGCRNQGNIRQGAIITRHNVVVEQIIRCKACASRTGGTPTLKLREMESTPTLKLRSTMGGKKW